MAFDVVLPCILSFMVGVCVTLMVVNEVLRRRLDKRIMQHQQAMKVDENMDDYVAAHLKTAREIGRAGQQRT